MGVKRITSNTGHILSNKKKVIPIDKDIRLFDQLKSLFDPYKENLEVKINTAVHYELWTKDGYRTISMNPVNKRGIEFAAIMIYENHVTLYFQPLYLDREIKDNLSESLKPLLQKKCCIRLVDLSDEIANDLKQLILRGWESYRRMGLIKRD